MSVMTDEVGMIERCGGVNGVVAVEFLQSCYMYNNNKLFKITC